MTAIALIDELKGLVESLGDDIDSHIAAERDFALASGETLETLGKSLGLSRERVRQRETKLKRRLGLRRNALSETLLGEISQFAEKVGQGLPQEDVVQFLPDPLPGSASLEHAGGLVLLFLYLAGPYELWDGLLLQARLGTKIESLCQQIWGTLWRSGC